MPYLHNQTLLVRGYEMVPKGTEKEEPGCAGRAAA